MKYLYIICLACIFNSCYSQSHLILEQTLISDWSQYPIYKRLIVSDESPSQWREEFSYLDDIDVFKIVYLSDGLKIQGLMAKPKKQGNYPCIIYNRGGNRQMGQLIVAHGALTLGKIAKEGYVVIASQYRGNGGSEGMEEFGGKDVNDVIILSKVLEEIESANTNKIGMYGWSRGGMMTYIALKQMDNIDAVVVGGGLTDLHYMIEDRPKMEPLVCEQLIPNYNSNKMVELDKRSAIKWVNKLPQDVPILLLHGNSDWRVKSRQCLEFASALDSNRIPYRLIMYEGGDHGLTEHRKEYEQEIVNWFDKYLKNNEPLPNMEYHGK